MNTHVPQTSVAQGLRKYCKNFHALPPEYKDTLGRSIQPLTQISNAFDTMPTGTWSAEYGRRAMGLWHSLKTEEVFKGLKSVVVDKPFWLEGPTPIPEQSGRIGLLVEPDPKGFNITIVDEQTRDMITVINGKEQQDSKEFYAVVGSKTLLSSDAFIQVDPVVFRAHADMIQQYSPHIKPDLLREESLTIAFFAVNVLLSMAHAGKQFPLQSPQIAQPTNGQKKKAKKTKRDKTPLVPAPLEFDETKVAQIKGEAQTPGALRKRLNLEPVKPDPTVAETVTAVFERTQMPDAAQFVQSLPHAHHMTFDAKAGLAVESYRNDKRDLASVYEALGKTALPYQSFWLEGPLPKRFDQLFHGRIKDTYLGAYVTETEGGFGFIFVNKVKNVRFPFDSKGILWSEPKPHMMIWPHVVNVTSQDGIHFDTEKVSNFFSQKDSLSPHDAAKMAEHHRLYIEQTAEFLARLFVLRGARNDLICENRPVAPEQKAPDHDKTAKPPRLASPSDKPTCVDLTRQTRRSTSHSSAPNEVWEEAKHAARELVGGLPPDDQMHELVELLEPEARRLFGEVSVAITDVAASRPIPYGEPLEDGTRETYVRPEHDRIFLAEPGRGGYRKKQQQMTAGAPYDVTVDMIQGVPHVVRKGRSSNSCEKLPSIEGPT